ncbi:MAG: ATP-dependent DNA helicase [Clostridia bacterium]|nr:ATP-dependent DNA helicase [Clostridia bacterium]
MEQMRASVRQLVEFTLHGEDIRPAGGQLRDMQEGTLGHRARQKLLGEGWEAEVPLSLTVEVEAAEWELLLAGRMDAFLDGNVPIIEEIKLWQRREPPAAPVPAHEMQAVCYGHMLCQAQGLAEVVIRVAYVDRGGRVRGQFDTPMTAGECQARFHTVLEPFLRRQRLLRQHTRARDASLQALRFPFDQYRPGQREMAVQVYTAARLGRRLFASMPTGTGKSVAALFPALKALGAGITGQVYYLTARTTQRQGAIEALRRMRRQPLHLWTLVIDAKDKQCPAKTLCHPDWCPRAKGHFLRDHAAIEEMFLTDDWSPEAIRMMAEKHCLCPFEFSLSLAEVADLTICDYNYALDPAVHIQRIFDKGRDVTLLIDEAHNLLSRVRDMLSGHVDGAGLRRLRTAVGKSAGRKHDLYKAMTAVLKALDDLPLPEDDAREGVLAEIPRSLDTACQELADAFIASQGERIDWGGDGAQLRDVLLPLLSFVRARRRDATEYAWLWQGRRQKTVHAFALDVASYFAEVTKNMRGVVCFSATMHPLEEMKRLLGGAEEDACFAMPSPFPQENLLLLQQDVNTRYHHREAACGAIAEAIGAMVRAKPGRYIAFFPSFAFMKQAAELLDVPCQMQRSGMTDAERAEFLAPYVPGGPEPGGLEPVLSLCVLGGVFAEGIDLPGDALDGVAIVGVGLPQVNLFQQTLREYYDRTMDAGFLYAYMLPGMQKVAQAVGRVIRTETDRGVALLLDDRYRQGAYRRLCPEHWTIHVENRAAQERLERFWRTEN